MKKVKQPKTNIKLVFEHGVSIQCNTTHSMDELNRIMDKGFDTGVAILDNIEDEMAIADSNLVIHMEKLMLYMVAEFNNSGLVTPNQPGKLHKMQ